MTALNLSKISLDKTRASISLDKRAAGFGLIRVNLDWNRKRSGGFFSWRKSVDLDIGCLFELQDGSKGAVQALGNAFGQLDGPPWIQLMGDDRTGNQAGGEWLHINGDQWSRVRRVLIYAFIYQGAPDWRETDAVIRLHVPDQAEIEVRLDQEGTTQPMCAIALLENDGGAVRVTRQVDFHDHHERLDHAYHWGLRWAAGSK